MYWRLLHVHGEPLYRGAYISENVHMRRRDIENMWSADRAVIEAGDAFVIESSAGGVRSFAAAGETGQQSTSRARIKFCK